MKSRNDPFGFLGRILFILFPSLFVMLLLLYLNFPEAYGLQEGPPNEDRGDKPAEELMNATAVVLNGVGFLGATLFQNMVTGNENTPIPPATVFTEPPSGEDTYQISLEFSARDRSSVFTQIKERDCRRNYGLFLKNYIDSTLHRFSSVTSPWLESLRELDRRREYCNFSQKLNEKLTAYINREKRLIFNGLKKRIGRDFEALRDIESSLFGYVDHCLSSQKKQTGWLALQLNTSFDFRRCLNQQRDPMRFFSHLENYVAQYIQRLDAILLELQLFSYHSGMEKWDTQAFLKDRYDSLKRYPQKTEIEIFAQELKDMLQKASVQHETVCQKIVALKKVMMEYDITLEEYGNDSQDRPKSHVSVTEVPSEEGPISTPSM